MDANDDLFVSSSTHTHTNSFNQVDLSFQIVALRE